MSPCKNDWHIDVCSNLSSQLTNLRWNVVLSIWSWRQTTKFAVERAYIPITQDSSHVRIINEDSAHHFLQYNSYIHFELIPQGQTVNQIYYVEILKLLHEAMYSKMPWTLTQQLNSPSWQFSSSQGTPCQALSDQKIEYWSGTHTLLPWFGSEWLVAVSEN
jgi:hypothetical protein